VKPTLQSETDTEEKNDAQTTLKRKADSLAENDTPKKAST